MAASKTSTAQADFDRHMERYRECSRDSPFFQGIDELLCAERIYEASGLDLSETELQRLYYEMAKTYTTIGRYDKAIERFRQALRLVPLEMAADSSLSCSIWSKLGWAWHLKSSKENDEYCRNMERAIHRRQAARREKIDAEILDFERRVQQYRNEDEEQLDRVDSGQEGVSTTDSSPSAPSIA